MAKNPTEVAAKWHRNLASSTESIRQGVAGVTRSPTEAAAAQQGAYQQGVQRAIDSGKWRRGLQAVSLQDWQRAMLDKGLQRVATGAASAKPKMESFMGQWLPHMDGLKSKLQSMPRGDLEQNKARMLAAVDHAASFRKT